MKSLTVEVVGKENIFPLWLGKYIIYYPTEVYLFMASRDINRVMLYIENYYNGNVVLSSIGSSNIL